MVLDKIDEQLLDLLQSDARLGISTLARTVGASRSTIQDRLARMEDRGIIAGYTVRLGDTAEGHQVRAQAMLKISPLALDDVVAGAKRVKAVRALYTVAGEFDLVAQMTATSTALLDDAIDALGRLNGVERTQSSVLLSKKFERLSL